MFLFAPFMTHIPLSALAGVLIMTALRMNEWEAIHFLFKNKLKSGMIEFFVTMIITVIFDLSTAILAGIIVGFLLFILKISQIEINSSQIEPERISQNHHEVFSEWTVIYISGPLFFLNSSKLKQVIDALPTNTNIVLSLRGVPMIDVTSIKLLIDIYSVFHEENRQIVFASMNGKLKESFRRTGLINLVGEEAIYPSVNEFLLDLVDKKN
ncbi:Sulfate permease [Lactococcus cremoris]|nr:Sulfate permease [Lactococcus cremoris]KZK54487.1 Sulfate permease [Lactococcus cremoris]